MNFNELKARSHMLNDCVWQSKDECISLGLQEIKILQDYSQQMDLRQFRYCLHSDNNNRLHKMLIFHNYPQAINWHAQVEKESNIFYHCLEGTISVVVSITGAQHHFHLSADDNKHDSFLSIPRMHYRRIITETHQSVFLEIAEGPFSDSDTMWKYSLN